MEASLNFLNMGTVEKKSIVLQGAGNVGRITVRWDFIILISEVLFCFQKHPGNRRGLGYY